MKETIEAHCLKKGATKLPGFPVSKSCNINKLPTRAFIGKSQLTKTIDTIKAQIKGK